MTMKSEIDREFERIAVVNGSGLVSITTPAGQLDCDLTSVDSIACAFERFEWTTDRFANATTGQLKKICEALSSRLSYLLEPISLIESDNDACVVQLRSNPPSREEDKTSYYELVASRGGSLKLCRFAKQPGAVRQVIPANVTREVFHRLASDFAAAAN